MRQILKGRFRQPAFVIIGITGLILLVIILGSQKNFGLEHYAQLVLDGIRGGSIYALIALGFVIIHSITGIINFAQGEFVMLGAMLCVTFFHSEISFLAPLNPALKLFLAIIFAVAGTTLVGVIMERLAIYPARRSPILTLIIIILSHPMTHPTIFCTCVQHPGDARPYSALRRYYHQGAEFLDMGSDPAGFVSAGVFL
jgi:branched-chain amino acid transport system permease protein